MNIYEYSLFAYLLTAALSFAVIGVIVGLTKFMAKNGGEKEETE